MFRSIVETGQRRPSSYALRFRAALVGVVFCVVGTLGCNSFRGLAQCRSVISTINGVLAQARDLHEREPTAERYKEITTLLRDLETTLNEATITDSDLKQAIEDYVKQLHRSTRDTDAYALTLEQLASAHASNDEGAIKTAEEELDKIRQRATRSLEGSKVSKRFRDACRK